MEPFELHPDFYNQPIRLSEDEKASPLEVLRDFFQTCHFSDIRFTLWKTVEAALSLPDSVFDSATERQTLLWFYSELERTLEAGLLLCKEGVYQKARQPEQPAPTPQPQWPTKAMLEHEIRGLKIENVLKENELIHLRFFKQYGRLMTDPETSSSSPAQ